MLLLFTLCFLSYVFSGIQSYLQRYEEDLAQVEAERSAQMAKLINWQEHWMEQLTILARFNSE